MVMAPKKTRPTNGPAVRRANLLIEIGVEELPPRTLQTLAEAFAAGLVRGLVEAGVLDDGPDNHHCFATPRRLAVLVRGVAARQPGYVTERRGPSLRAAYDDHGKPSRAAEGFAKSCGGGVTVAQLDTLKNEQGAWLVYRQKVAGLQLAEIVTDCLGESVRRLPIARRMRWGARSVEFVRPAHWLLALHGAGVLKSQVLGLKADRFTRGHRFHATGKLRISNADADADADGYAALLESEGRVIADFDRRRGVIQKQLAQLAAKAGARVVADAGLLEMVTGMVEWPRASLGAFDGAFLKLPGEVLVSCMGEHQKYFHLTDAKGKLLPRFIAVSNIASKSPARVRRGNERVLRARLADAEFFWNSDLKTPLASRTEELKGVLFHNRLGSLHDKTARVSQLARFTAEQLNTDADNAAHAALLCKADLVTGMVGEFPELQGTMGRYYAKKAGEDKPVAEAIEQHYWPRYSGDRLPRTPLAQSVAVADRIDSLAGIFAGGEIPTGDKDPFALRRAALGVLRILIEKQLDLDLHQLLQASRDIYQTAAGAGSVTVTPDAETIERVFEFMLERLKAYYQPMGYTAAQLASVMACRPSKPLDFDRRLKALSHFFAERPEAAESLAAANKRIAGILGKAVGDFSAPARYDETLFREKAETELARQLDRIGARARSCFADNRYDRGFAALSELRRPVDLFFDEVMVMDEDAVIRNNRLALLGRIRELFLDAADISCMGAER